MRSILLLILVFLMGCVATFNPITPQKLTGPELAKQLTNETVALVFIVPSKNTKWNDKVYVFCTGVYVSETTILSAAHCIQGYAHMASSKKETEAEEAKMIEIPTHMRIPFSVPSEIVAPGRYPKTKPHMAEVIYSNSRQDLALLRVVKDDTLPTHSFVKLAKTNPPVGAKVEAMGNIERQYFSYREGVVSAYRETMQYAGEKDIDGPFLQASILIYKGDSGGPLVDDVGGLLGIASFVNVEAAGIAYYINRETIGSVLKANDI